MTISHSEYARLTCPACSASFEADIWTLVDAEERPDLLQALRDNQLNLVDCPHCGHQAPANAALLLHSPASRRVYYAVPAGVGEHAWRERAQELLYRLVESLPEEERRPYLGDVQVEHELEGVRRAVMRRERGRGASSAASSPSSSPAGVAPQSAREAPAPVPERAQTQPAPLVNAVHALLAANDDAEFTAIVAANPQLLGDDASALIRQLADQAYENGEPALAAALSELRSALARRRAGAPAQAPAREARASTPATPARDAVAAPPARPPATALLADAAYQALLHVDSPAALRAAVRDYPTLLEPAADGALAARSEEALDAGNERLARTIESLREALAELRAQVGAQDPLMQAVQALLRADGEDAVAELISAHPILLTDAAQAALSSLADSAWAQGDRSLAEYAITCQDLLRTVRAGLEADSS